MTFARCSRGEKRAASAYKEDYNTVPMRCQQRFGAFFTFFLREIYKTFTYAHSFHGMM